MYVSLLTKEESHADGHLFTLIPVCHEKEQDTETGIPQRDPGSGAGCHERAIGVNEATSKRYSPEADGQSGQHTFEFPTLSNHRDGQLRGQVSKTSGQEQGWVSDPSTSESVYKT